MKLRDRVLRFAIAVAVAGTISAQIPMSGGTALADSYTNTSGDDSGDFLGLNGISNRNVVQGAVVGLVGYGVYATVLDGRHGGLGGSGGAGSNSSAGSAGAPDSAGNSTGIASGDSARPIYDVDSADSDLSTFNDSVNNGDMKDTLREDKGPYTVFAPTNAAFAKLSADTSKTLMDPANKSTLKNLLSYHTVKGRYTIADLKKMKDGTNLFTVNGGTVTITNTGGLKVNGVSVIEKDILASNGITHPIDSVLSAPTP